MPTPHSWYAAADEALARERSRAQPPACPHLANNADDCWECFDAKLPGPATRADMEAWGPGEDYESRESR